VRWIVATSLKFRYLVIGLALVVTYFGVQTIGHQKLDVFPEFAPVSVEIQTACLGLSPSEVEQLTTVPLEAALQGVPGVNDIRSDSEPQLSAIFLYFNAGTNELHARQLVQERLQSTAPSLPTWCDAPQVYPIVSATSRIIQIGLTSTKVAPMDLSMISQWMIRPRLMSVPGVANVAIWGRRNKQIMIEANPAELAKYHISLGEVQAVAANAVDTTEVKYVTGAKVGALGYVDNANQRIYLRDIEPITTPAQMAAIPVTKSGNTFVRIGQLANVVWGYPPLTGDAVIDGRPGEMLVVEKFPGANTLQVTNGVLAALKQMAPGLKGINVDPNIFRQADFIQLAIHNLSLSVLLGCILVVFVLFAFLFQWRGALISLLAIPLSLAAAAIVFDATGTTINTMILAGFAVAVGVVVDDAIIDMENIIRRLRAWRAAGKRITPLHLVLAASLEVRVAIFYATLINIVAVIPVMLVGGLTGAFFRPLAFAYGIAVLASMLVALTVTPALGLLLLPSAPLKAADPPLMRILKKWYGAILKPVLKIPTAALAVALALVVFGLVLYPKLGSDLFPTFKEPDFLMHFVTKSETSVGEMDRQVTQVQDEVMKIKGVSQIGAHIGTAPLGEEVNGVNFSENWIALSKNANYDKVMNEIRAAAASHPGAYSDVLTYLHERIDEVLTNGTTEDLAVRIYGPNLATLTRIAGQMTHAFDRIPGLVDVQPAPLEFIPEIDITVKTAVAEKYGLTPGGIRREAAIMVSSEPVAEIPTNGEVFTIAMWSTPQARANLQSLYQLPLDTPSGGHVPLGTVASIVLKPAPSVIYRENGQRSDEVDADISGRSLGSTIGAVHAALAKIRLPHGYTVAILGEATERAAAQKSLIEYGIGALLLIWLLLQAAFKSWRLSILEFFTLPMALVGGVIAAWADLGTITLGALVGFFTVLGIAARNGILMISHFQHLELEEGEQFGPGLVIRGASERLSPILMTALATALALAPLVIYGDRPGQEIEYPMAVVILGGLATSTLLNLFVLPALYLRFARPKARPPSEPEAQPQVVEVSA
jgi:CzcA family heavy metal efflux pump